MLSYLFLTHNQDSWLCETEKKTEDDNIENESEPEQEISDEEESDEESKYSDMELRLSDTDEFARLLALGQIKEKEITMLFKLTKREKNQNQKKKMNKWADLSWEQSGGEQLLAGADFMDQPNPHLSVGVLDLILIHRPI